VEDDRPATLKYITETILTPTCASAECHSSFTREVNDQFDSVAATRRSVVANGLVLFPDDTVDADAATNSYLVRSLRVGNPSLLDPGSGNIRMPFDAPMPEADIRLIEKWIGDGAHGAQCEPTAQNLGCGFITDAKGKVTFQVVECVDGDVGKVVETCPDTQACTVLSGNGKCV
jgi:hypothetical protein